MKLLAEEEKIEKPADKEEAEEEDKEDSEDFYQDIDDPELEL